MKVGAILTLLVALVAVALFVGGGDDRFPDYRYKMTIYVATADGEKAFSSVRQVRQKEITSIIDSSGRAVETKLSGEAVIMDRGDGRVVYALLSWPDNRDYGHKVPSYALLPHTPKEGNRGDSQTRYAKRMQAMVAVKGPIDLPPTRPNPDHYRGTQQLENWPMFVAFGDPADSRSVQNISPESIGVRRITIEITDESVTTGIEKRLGWLPQLKGKSLSGSGSSFNAGSPFGLDGGYFTSEFIK